MHSTLTYNGTKLAGVINSVSGKTTIQLMYDKNFSASLTYEEYSQVVFLQIAALSVALFRALKFTARYDVTMRVSGC